jgi:DNA-binding transcriptional MerR regulator
MPTSEEIDALIKEEDEALEQKYQRLLKKRQELDARIAETVKALGEQKMMNHILEGIKSDLEKQG